MIEEANLNNETRDESLKKVTLENKRMIEANA